MIMCPKDTLNFICIPFRLYLLWEKVIDSETKSEDPTVTTIVLGLLIRINQLNN